MTIIVIGERGGEVLEILFPDLGGDYMGLFTCKKSSG